MYLKRLTLRGFKSFASATTLNFEPGITCVVGPNGSGKSNVVDALSWVMGEQGAKSLRGGKMEDVIFAGTSSRPPLGRAEVVLTIDNSDGALPIDYTEVSISRTMFRNGGSEYAINGSPARLLDVQELLSDSGIGREMHVIVGQGQLDTILQATPEIRRGFIEEAAGILKHRKRKEKAVRKLESTKANLERLTDLIGEIRRQLKPLGRQAEVARKAAIIQAELRDAKARLLADDLVNATRALEEELACEAAARAAQDRAEAEARASAQAEAEAETALTQAAARFSRVQELWYGAAALRERVASTVSISAERTRHGAAAPQLELGGRDPEELEAEAGQVRQQEAGLRAEAGQADAALTEATQRRNAAEARHAEAEQAYLAAQRAVADRREGLARLAGQVNSLRSRLDASAEELGRLDRRRTDALNRAEEANLAFRTHEVSLASLSDSESDLDAAYESAVAELGELERELADLTAAETAASQRRAALAARVEALRLGLDRADASEAVAASNRPGVAGRVSGLVEVEPGWEKALSVALGPAADGVAVAGMAEAMAIVAELKAADEGRAGLVVAAPGPPGDAGAPPRGRYLIDLISAPPDYRGALAHLLAGVVAVEDVADALAVAEAMPGISCVTRDGTLISPALVVGGSDAKPSLIEVHAAVEQAEAELGQAQHELERIRFTVAEVRARAGAAREREQAALALLHESDAQVSGLADQLARYRQTAASASQEAERLAEAMTQAEATRERDLAALKGLEARLEAATGEGELTEPDPAERDELAAAARLERQRETEARLALRTAEERIRALAGRAEALRRAAERERQARAKALALAERQRREAQVAAEVHRAATELLGLVEAARERASQEKELAEQSRKQAEVDLTAARHRHRAASSALEEIVRGAHRDEMARIEQRMRLEQLAERALAELGLEPDTLMAEYGPHQPVPVLTGPDGGALGPDEEQPEPVPYDRDQQAARLRAAERNLAVLGRVNPLALEEYEAMSARHGFLAEQLDDLKSTRQDLLDIIAEVDAKVEQVFAEAYRDVERTFGEVFSRLFPGGQGRLVLTEPGDWLTTGVDVEAKPAGKQVKRLSLLSGGERSRVAVAFLVSLFIARPSPFYILDEVEAALDDVNLSRLLGIYAELRESSQLLIITHQKRTMEIADALYGVTMRGDGISAVISQRLRDGDEAGRG
ncbi:MAG: chromosome segregation protein SMC [Propionibacteriaceae bacterium]|nr:chromosome segregation protein SMC [Propionibacteriaceae bacterium]